MLGSFAFLRFVQFENERWTFIYGNEDNEKKRFIYNKFYPGKFLTRYRLIRRRVVSRRPLNLRTFHSDEIPFTLFFFFFYLACHRRANKLNANKNGAVCLAENVEESRFEGSVGRGVGVVSNVRHGNMA